MNRSVMTILKERSIKIWISDSNGTNSLKLVPFEINKNDCPLINYSVNSKSYSRIIKMRLFDQMTFVFYSLSIYI